jgi:hypothetical protein
MEEGELQVQGQPVLHSEFQASLTYIMRPCHKNINKIFLNKEICLGN